MRILITGASGYIGGRLIEVLSKSSQDYKIIIGLRAKINQRFKKFSNLKVKKIDLNSLSILNELCKDIDTVVHLAGANAKECQNNPAEALLTNSVGTSNLLQAAINNRVKRFICMSSIHVYGELLSGDITEKSSTNPSHPYSSSHKSAEDIVKFAHQQKKIEGIIVRLSNSIGPPINKEVNCWELLVNDLCMQALTSNRMILRTSGTQTRDFLSMTDTCGIIEHLIHLPSSELGNGYFNAGSGTSRTVLEMTKIIRDRVFIATNNSPKIFCKIADLYKSDLYMNYSINKLLSTGFKFSFKENFNKEIDNLISFILKNNKLVDGYSNTNLKIKDFDKQYLEFKESDMLVKNHDLNDGPQDRCQICGSKDLKVVIDLGAQPLGDKLKDIDSKNDFEHNDLKIYPLTQVWCSVCSLNQLNYICPSHVLFGDDYSYKTGVTKELVEYQAGMATELIDLLGIKKEDLVCDIGSNDGTLLKGFVNKGINVIGVEPTDIADIANEEGITTLRMPFGEYAANGVVAQAGQAKLATATNVFAHVQKLGDFIRGLDILLKDDGYFCFENHYLTEIIDKLQYDSIYHEHLRSLSVSSVVNLFAQYDFSVIGVQKASRYGGNMRVLVQKGIHIDDGSVKKFLEIEKNMGLFQEFRYTEFKSGVVSTKINLLEFLINLQKLKKTIAGYSLPARAITLINYVGIDKDLLPFVVEQPSSLKLNKFVPGTRIPVISNDCLEVKNLDYLLVFAWHLKDEIINHLRKRGLKGHCLFPLPEVHIVKL